MIKIGGQLLYFENKNRYGLPTITKDTIIHIPEKIPLVFEFNINDPNSVLGNCVVEKNANGLYCIGLLNDNRLGVKKFYEDLAKAGWGLGGYYDHVNSHIVDREEGELHEVSECVLRAVSVTEKPLQHLRSFTVEEVQYSIKLMDSSKEYLDVAKEFFDGLMDGIGECLSVRPPSEIKKDIKHEKNPMRLK